jgi:hypothetical protein
MLSDGALAPNAYDVALLARTCEGRSMRTATGSTVSQLMSVGPLQPPRAIAANDAFVLRSPAIMTAHMVVRGAGLVASAYGMLHCRDAVAALVARWRDGPWTGRLNTPADVTVAFPCSRRLSCRAAC